MHGYNDCKIRALMKHRITPLLVLAALTCAFGVAQAEKADRSKPMNIEADALRHDEVKQTSVFSGRVVMTKGSIVLRGARLDVRQDAEGYQSGIVTAEAGKRAFFRQKRDTLPGAPEEFIEGEGEVIEYDGRTDNVRFITRAELRRYRGGALSDEITGAVVVYNNLTDVFTVDGQKKALPAGGSEGQASSGGRVRAVLAPKDPKAPAAAPGSSAASPAPAASAPVLRPSTSLGGATQ
jgi:lipopolysaccharide export system protein LptA